MKSLSALILLALFSLSSLNGQKAIVVTEDSLQFGKAHMPALTVTIPEVNYETTLKSWTKELQSGTKSKLVIENNNLTIFGAKIKDISSTPVNVYSRLVNLDSVLRLTVSFELKKDEYVERTNSEADLNKAKIYLKEFAKNEYLDIAKDQADAEDKKLRDLQKELSSLEKDKNKLQKSIESENSTIYTENDNITTQKNELETVSAELIEQNKQLNTPEGEAVKKEKTDYINSLEKRKKKAQNEIESSNNKINKANNEIDKAKAEIPKNERMQEQVNEKIEKQQAVYQMYADKVKNIKSY